MVHVSCRLLAAATELAWNLGLPMETLAFERNSGATLQIHFPTGTEIHDEIQLIGVTPDASGRGHTHAEIAAWTRSPLASNRLLNQDLKLTFSSEVAVDQQLDTM